MSYKAIHPKGWLLDFLKTQKTGLTGNIAKADHPYYETFWGSHEEHSEYKGIFWWPYEQTAYYIDGLTRLAILLEDQELLKKAEGIIYSVINEPDKDGYLGPEEIKENPGSYVRWSHVVFFRACLALYAHNHDERIVNAMVKHYLGFPYDYSKIRNVFNAEILLELYRHTGNKAMLEMAEDAYVRGHDNEVTRALKKLSSRSDIHGVSYNEYAKLGAMLYAATGKKEYLSDSVRAYQKMNQKYMLPGGCNSSSEHMANNLYYEPYELCNVADMTWSLSYLAKITDNILYWDMIEACIFNAGIGAVTEDFRGLQYFSCANQIILNETSSHCRVNIGGTSMAYSPRPLTACCSGNVNRFMPNFALHLWSQDADTVTAQMYAPSCFEGEINGEAVQIEEKTRYPFDLSFAFCVKTRACFTLRLRIPAWCTNLQISGATYTTENGFAVLKIEGDTTISVTMDANIEKCENHGGIYYKRGPLVYTLGMKGIRETHGDAEFPAYRMKPDQKWNYAIVEDCVPVYNAGNDTAWDVDSDLPSITVQAREVLNWKVITKSKFKGVNWSYEPIVKEGKFRFTPQIPGKLTLANEVVTLKLVPYGAAKVRMTVLPEASGDPT